MGICQTRNKKNFNRIFKATRRKHQIENFEYIDCRNKVGINMVKSSSIFFLNLKTSRAAQSAIRNITNDEK